MAGSTYTTSGSQNTTKLDNDRPSPSQSSPSSKFSNSVREILHKPDTKKDEKLNEPKPYKTEKANFLDRTDPNEMGRNTDQIISELENEDKKMQSKKSPSSSSTTASSKPETKNNKTTASTTTTTTTTSADTTSDPGNNEVSENSKESDIDKA
jgi:hypothetical protein